MSSPPKLSRFSRNTVHLAAKRSVGVPPACFSVAGGGYNSSLAEIDPSGKVVWNLTKDDVPEMGFDYAAGSQRLPDGTAVVASYHGAVPVFAVSQDRKVLWTCKNQEMGKPSHVKGLSQKQMAAFWKRPIALRFENNKTNNFQ